ncbi:LysR family transcriptional regulator [Kosakonia radicincitans]|uniref:LysR family transcriptional regulator n=1 Tax=Kosakonia radicincitans TaxID=283686 RepID=UPI0011840A97|nr:LysR family transcriptional regulator [Kosakonia radicincitans]QEM93008.1 LysR family transcriptional regulator [Kosakonia radicincitans]VVT47725.1 Transcriptional regulator, LysR family [Kosakonia radicincitans]
MDRLTAMKVFINVVELGSLTAAANRMDISRAMATRYIASLESELRVRLLHRTSRCLGPTSDGCNILSFCRQIIALNEDIELATAGRHTEPQGLIRVASSISFGQSYLAGAIARYAERFPKTSVEMVLGDHAVNLNEGAVDLAIIVGSEPAQGMISRLLTRCPSVVCAAPAYLDRCGAPGHPDDLRQHNCLNHTRFGNTWRFCPPSGEPNMPVIEVEVSGSIAANDSMVLLSAALNGKGIVHLPAFTCSSDIQSGALVALFPDYQLPQLDVYAAYASRKYLPATTRSLLDFLLTDIIRS